MKNIPRRLFSIATLGLALLLPASAQIESEGQLNVWTTKSVSRPHAINQAAYVKTVRAAKQNEYDRVVFEFDGAFPNYRVEYLKSHFYEGTDGRHRIRSAGNAFVQINFFVVPTDEQIKFSEAKNFVPKGKLGMPTLQSVKDKELFEGYYDFLMGVSSRKPFRVTELSNPARLVIDFKH